MKTSKFKTTAKCGGCVAKIGETLDKVVARDQWNIDPLHSRPGVDDYFRFVR